MKKLSYEQPIIKTVVLTDCDVVRTSGLFGRQDGDNDTGWGTPDVNSPNFS